MGRQPRAGQAGKLVGVRVTDAERTHWERAAKIDGCTSLSAAIVKVMNAWAARAVPEPKRKRKRCPRCHQLLYLVNGTIEKHRTLMSGPRGGKFGDCVPEEPSSP